MARIVFSLLAALLWATAAQADGELERRITAQDRQRLDGFEAALQGALAEARAGGSPEDLAVLDDALAGAPLPIASGYDPVGNWRCRTIKLGGGLPIVVYGWFKCRISDDGAGWMLEKLTGSQRTRGFFFTLSDTRLAYLGAGHVAGEAPRRYGEAERENQVAIAERRAENRIILLFPAPHYESNLDVLVLER